MLTVSHKENIAAATDPALRLEGADLIAARELCGDVRRALDGILTHVTSSARDLQAGLTWSPNLERFELASMEQARILAKFPISTADQRFGALVHRARASFVAFRETVRREIIGTIDRTTDDTARDIALQKVVGRSALAGESLKSVERAITRYSMQVPAALQNSSPRGLEHGELAR